VQLLLGGGTPLLSANAQWLGPGGESILLRHHDSDLIVYHAYDHATGKPSLQISTIAWKDGWPSAALLDH
jgi:arabinan endo-1,5-alpha-L-arabinosidase